MLQNLAQQLKSKEMKQHDRALWNVEYLIDIPVKFSLSYEDLQQALQLVFHVVLSVGLQLKYPVAKTKLEVRRKYKNKKYRNPFLLACSLITIEVRTQKRKVPSILPPYPSSIHDETLTQ